MARARPRLLSTACPCRARGGGWLLAALLPILVQLVLLEPLALADEPYGRHQFDDYQQEHWSFVPVERPSVPEVSDTSWVATPIDAFILERLEAKGLRPAPPAAREILLRRVYLDLIGLPPTLSEQQAFLHDDQPDALARVVDQLLARPQYGERWARHWLDVVRYAESNGYERDGAKPEAWRYRDWVIGALNDDMPFDRFLIEQVAGDELDDTDAQSQIATTFLRLGPWDDEPADPRVDRYDQLDDVLGTTATAFLGITLRCARCHDHKFEPFTQLDYARFLAAFEPLRRPQNGRTDLARHVGTPTELEHYRQQKAAADARLAELQAEIDVLDRTIALRVLEGEHALPAEVARAVALAPEERNDADRQLVKEHESALAALIEAAASSDEAATRARLRSERDKVDASRPAEPPSAYVWFEEGPASEPTQVFDRGDPYHPLATVEPGLPAILVDAPPPPPVPTAHSTGRRRQLAEWMASPENPLTARVFVNRLWQQHFGEGLVSTESDFGLMGDGPTHPELLDWLASELVSGGWRVKRLHRLIVLSNAYQAAALDDPHSSQIDPDVRLLWRWRPRRLEAEAIRDAVLAVSGELNLAAGGPSVFPEMSAEVLASQSQPGNGWQPSPPTEQVRRSIYVFVKRTLPLPELDVLDAPNTNISCEQRQVSTTSTQALTWFNGSFVHQQAARWADRLWQEHGGCEEAAITGAFRQALCRQPTDEELALVRDFLAAHAAQIERDEAADASAETEDEVSSLEASRRALAAFCLVLLNSNEFVYLP